MSEVESKCKLAKEASRKLGLVSSKIKNKALSAMAAALLKNEKEIIEANSVDLEAGEKKGLSASLLDRLALDNKRIQGMINSLEVVKSLPDPIGEVLSEWKRPNGLNIQLNIEL